MGASALPGRPGEGAESSRSRGEGVSCRTVLLVEDDEYAREMLTLALTAAGAQVTTASNGLDGLRAAEAHRPELVITDVAMPYMDGIEMVRRLRQWEATQGVPIVAVTGQGEGLTSTEARAAGCTAVLSKPCHLDVLLRIVDHYVGRRREDHAASREGERYTGLERRER